MDNTIFPLTALHIEGQIDGWIDRYCDDISRKKPLPALDICYQQVLRIVDFHFTISLYNTTKSTLQMQFWRSVQTLN
ncbi:hypothetical protein T4A_4478 [Trichinella pseudospiralis]|uniref:Uncharacterized protein n=1 Tax=Trichinella pseudospiralis TaxID=6337 RepID=A0A0V1E3G2_TRIPS|nr:hypothetical protein T4A_4478 [Trichinella pseudospiralis]